MVPNMHFYCSGVLCILLLAQPVIPFLFVNPVSPKAVQSQITVSNYLYLFRASHVLQEHVSDYISSDAAPSNFGEGGQSYSSLLFFYLSQNLKPKFDLCLKVIKKIVDQEGLDATVKICESLEATVSAESYRLTNNALLSVLVSLRLPDAAASHLSRLLQQVNSDLELDAPIIADLLKLYMPIERDDYTTLTRRKYKKRAVEASSLYTKIIAYSKFSVDGRSVAKNGSSVERGYVDADASEEPFSATDDVHEYGARALASSNEWKRALDAVACIGQRHLLRPQMKTFTMQLLQRLIQIDSNQQSQQQSQQQQQQQLGVIGTASMSEVSNPPSESLALSLTLLQPLNLFPVDCPLLHACLLQLSASPIRVHTVTSHIYELRKAGSAGKDAGWWRDSVSRATVREPSSSPSSSDLMGRSIYSFSALFPAKIAVQLVQRMFLSGCDSEQLVKTIDSLWMGAGAGADSSTVEKGHVEEGCDLIVPEFASSGPYVDMEQEQHLMKKRRLSALDAIEVAVRCACLLRDGREEAFESNHLEYFTACAARLPSKINAALSPLLSTSTSTTKSTATAATSPFSAEQTMILESCSCAIDASLLLLSASLRAVGQQQRISSLLQDIAEYTAPSPSSSSSETAGKSSKLAVHDQPPPRSNRMKAGDLSAEESTRVAWASKWTWSPNTELLAQVVCLVCCNLQEVHNLCLCRLMSPFLSRTLFYDASAFLLLYPLYSRQLLSLPHSPTHSLTHSVNLFCPFLTHLLTH